MAEAKTKPTAASVVDYLASIEDEERRSDCQAIAELMKKVTNQEPVMWGTSIVGFGIYSYAYKSGHTGQSCQVGFSPRKGDISLYLLGDSPGRDELLCRLGKHKTGKACLYVKRLRDVDVEVLERLIAASYAEIKKRHGTETSGA